MLKNQTIFNSEIADMTKSETSESLDVRSLIPDFQQLLEQANKAMHDLLAEENLENEEPGVTTQDSLIEDSKKVTILVRVLYHLLKIYGFDDEHVSPKLLKDLPCFESNQEKKRLQKLHRQKSGEDKQELRRRYLQYIYFAGKGSWKDLFKYKINAFFSHIRGQELPPSPPGLEFFPFLIDPNSMFVGRAKRFMKRLLLDRKQSISFSQSIAQSKKGAPPVSKSMVKEAEIKCFKHLTTAREDLPPFVISDGVFDFAINRDTMKYQLRRTVREIFRNKFPTWSELTKPFVPSTNSNYNFSRTGLGGVGALLTNKTLRNIISNEKFFRDKQSFIRKELGPVFLSDEISVLYGEAGKLDQIRIDGNLENVTRETIGLHFDGSDLELFWREQIYPALLEESLKEKPRTIVIGLPEPLKVRCITAGPPLTYACLKPMQKFLWSTLKKLPTFQLIGTPITPEIVTKILGRLGDDEEFISGDYKASTDNLHSWVSETLLESLIEIWSENRTDDQFFDHINDFKVLMKRALTGHEILHPSMNEFFIKTGRESDGENPALDGFFQSQKEGQLMGSIISFPFLCLANAAMCRWAMEITSGLNLSLIKESKDASLARLLINGDDCVFPGKKDVMFSNWKQITAFGGLETSVGKTFVSSEFLTMNSVQYEYHRKEMGWEQASGLIDDFEFEEIKYVNMALVYGQKKSGDRGKTFFQLGSVHRELQRTCPPELFAMATRVFLKEAKKPKMIWSKELKKEVENPFGSILLCNVPYYIPEWLGGLGLVPTQKDHIPNDWDLKVAGVLRGKRTSFSIKTVKEEPLWMFHKLVDDELRDYLFLQDQPYKTVSFNGQSRDLGKEYQRLYSLSVVNSLLTRELTDIINTSEDGENRLRLNHFYNRMVWRRLRTDPVFGSIVANEPVANFNDILQEKKDLFLSCFDVGNLLLQEI